jgi:nitrous oxide reductase accessory protein NosL
VAGFSFSGASPLIRIILAAALALAVLTAGCSHSSEDLWRIPVIVEQRK